MAAAQMNSRFSSCGWVDEDLTLADRSFCCEQCGQVLDRDLNAAINLSQVSQARRQFVGEAKRLWRGERWLGSDGSSATLPGEAGTKHV
jgi:transposase